MWIAISLGLAVLVIGWRYIAARRLTAARAVFQAALTAWLRRCAADLDRSRWTPQSTVDRLLTAHPPPAVDGYPWHKLTSLGSPTDRLRTCVEHHNAEHLQRQRLSMQAFFSTVEKNSLTDEQIAACVCMDDAVLIVAAAGSGKTSTMVAKTGYALHERLATPDQILLLAFNRDAADELGSRIETQLKSVPDIDKVRSQTFHGFGLEIIGKATGRKPTVAPWLESGQDVEQISDIIDGLCSQDAAFALRWWLYRTVYARPIDEAAEPDTYRDGVRGFLTADNKVVKSQQERLICDWLFYLGVNYEYETPYEHDTTTAANRQYRPDFYYPELKLYHEHFALNAAGQPPPQFSPDYLEGVAWKRALHAEHGTALIETQSHEIYSGRAFEKLKVELTRRGLQMHFDPGRRAPGLSPPKQQDIARTFRVFQQHVKNNGLSMEDLQVALSASTESEHAERSGLFLSLYEQIAAEWERRLREQEHIDFEDMLLQAAHLVETGRYPSPFTLILADEFQDSSRARLRLLKALANSRPEPVHLCVVGDDWQGINRFAGSDIAVMTEFDRIFPHSTRLTLNTTFRCPQALCDFSSQFIQQNPIQIRKSVRSTNKLRNLPLQAYGLSDQDTIVPFVSDLLAELAQRGREGWLRPTAADRISVLLLGRYRSDEPHTLAAWQARFADVLRIEFKTVHRSKGLEAEYVFVLNVIESIKGFPSQIQDDPVLQLAMPTPDPYPFAEERRLFYVAMTRARRQVRFFTVNDRPSRFLLELVRAGALSIEATDGPAPEPCPACGKGVLLSRRSRYGEFLACSRIGQCGYTQNTVAM